MPTIAVFFLFWILKLTYRNEAAFNDRSLFVPSVLWHCWLGHLTCKNPSPIWPIMVFGGTLSLTQSINQPSPLLFKYKIYTQTVSNTWSAFPECLKSLFAQNLPRTIDQSRVRCLSLACDHLESRLDHVRRSCQWCSRSTYHCKYRIYSHISRISRPPFLHPTI